MYLSSLNSIVSARTWVTGQIGFVKVTLAHKVSVVKAMLQCQATEDGAHLRRMPGGFVRMHVAIYGSMCYGGWCRNWSLSVPCALAISLLNCAPAPGNRLGWFVFLFMSKCSQFTTNSSLHDITYRTTVVYVALCLAGRFFGGCMKYVAC